MRVPFAVLLGIIAAAARVGGAQVGYLWTFDELRAKADLVVIAEHVETIDTLRRRDHPCGGRFERQDASQRNLEDL